MLLQTWCKINNAGFLRFSGFCNSCHFYVIPIAQSARLPFTFFSYGVLSPNSKPKTMKIKIEKPCHEDWSTMTSEAQGKFCNACEKSVVDFSIMSDAQILNYFSQPKSQKVCGRFNADQVDRALVNRIPERPSPPPQLLHFAYLLVVVLGVGLTSCSNTVTGKPQILMGDTIISSKPVKKDSTSSRPNPILPVEVNPARPITVPPSPKTYIKGKVKITKPPVITVDPIIEDHKIMGECVIPEPY